jgi:hypothetical protein
MPKDREKAREWLEEYLSHLKKFYPAYSLQKDERPQTVTWIRQNEPKVAMVVGDLLPDETWYPTESHGNWVPYQHRVIEMALGVIANEVDVTEHWSPDDVIELDADALHPWVWDSAKGAWDAELWGGAVEAAIKVIQRKLQDRIERRDLSGTTLVEQSFGLAPPSAGQARLRVAEDDGSETYRSKQQGAMFLGQAVFSLWRNPLSHEPDDMPRQEALEALAGASTFARLVEGAEIVGPPSADPNGTT